MELARPSNLRLHFVLLIVRCEHHAWEEYCEHCEHQRRRTPTPTRPTLHVNVSIQKKLVVDIPRKACFAGEDESQPSRRQCTPTSRMPTLSFHLFYFLDHLFSGRFTNQNKEVKLTLLTHAVHAWEK